jgi:hypothetical protein
MPGESYGEWPNCESWNANDCLTNDERTYDVFIEMAEEVWENAKAESILSRSHVARRELGRRIRDKVEDDIPIYEAGLYLRLLTDALSHVKWEAIADSFLADCYDYERADRASKPRLADLDT